MSTYAIGDIHGCLDELNQLLDKINPTKEDTVITLGDMIDRGPNSKGVIERLLKLKTETNYIPIMGNHEDMLLYYYLKRHDPYLFLSNGGDATLKSYGIKPFDPNDKEKFTQEHLEFLNTCNYIYEKDNYIFVHAGINPAHGKKQQVEDLLWIRSKFIGHPTNIDKKIIFGHSQYKNPHIENDKIGIDTACFISGKLTAIKVPEEEFIFNKDHIEYYRI